MSFARLPSAFRYLLMLPQNITEAVLAQRIEELGGSIRRGVTAERVEHDASGARVTVVDHGERRVIFAKWVVGGDGMHSLVRRAAGLEFDGATYEDSFVLADVHLDRAPDPDEVSLYFSPDGLVVVAPLPDGSYRIVATAEDAPEHPGRADVQALLDLRGPSSRTCRVIDVTWSSRFRLHHRLAKSYRSGRLLLMGDAAHVHSPAGGQGMNTGIIDAVVLGRLLADIVSGVRPEAEIELYQSLRRPAAAKVLELAGRLTTLATMRGRVMRLLRNALLRMIDKLAPLKRRIALSLSGIARAGLSRLPEPTTARAEGPDDESSIVVAYDNGGGICGR